MWGPNPTQCSQTTLIGAAKILWGNLLVSILNSTNRRSHGRRHRFEATLNVPPLNKCRSGRPPRRPPITTPLGLTINAGHENDGQTKSRGRKMTAKMSEVENSGQENDVCRSVTLGYCVEIAKLPIKLFSSPGDPSF